MQGYGHITIKYDPEVDLTYSNSTENQDAGTYVQYPFTVTNNGNGEDQFVISTESITPLTLVTNWVANEAQQVADYIDSVELASHLANVGDAKSLAIHPATTTVPAKAEALKIAFCRGLRWKPSWRTRVAINSASAVGRNSPG